MNDQSTLFRKCDGTNAECRDGAKHLWHDVPVTETLLTREEAANDPEVQDAVLVKTGMRQWYRMQGSEVTDDE